MDDVERIILESLYLLLSAVEDRHQERDFRRSLEIMRSRIMDQLHPMDSENK